MDIIFKNVEHLYQKGTPFEKVAITNIDLNIQSGTFVSVIGHTGSGKSTLIQHINALLKPSSGSLWVGDKEIKAGKKTTGLKSIRKRVGFVFQYPEHQLFEETVEKDICFGPLNFGMSEKKAKELAKKALSMVGLSQKVLHKSPFDLSGGQMRRVAIAGVLAMEPDVVILDEPTAGLDPNGQKEILYMFQALHKEKELTTILVTHNMEDAAKYSDHIIVMNNGKVYIEGSPKEIFSKPEQLYQVGLDLPESIQLMKKLEETFDVSLPKDVFSIEEIANQIERLLKRSDRK